MSGIGHMPDRQGIQLLRFRAKQAAGKARRFFRANIYTSKNEELLARRQGECTRCGACCKILFKCPFLVEEPGSVYSCAIYGNHFSQCRLFPITPQDLEEIEEPCGYSFVNSNSESKNSESSAGSR